MIRIQYHFAASIIIENDSHLSRFDRNIVVGRNINQSRISPRFSDNFLSEESQSNSERKVCGRFITIEGYRDISNQIIVFIPPHQPQHSPHLGFGS